MLCYEMKVRLVRGTNWIESPGLVKINDCNTIIISENILALFVMEKNKKLFI